MNPQGRVPAPVQTEPRISLHHLVSQLITSLQPLAVRRNNILLNDIPRDLAMEVDQNMVAYVLSEMMNSAVNSTENQCLHIEAVIDNEHRMLRVTDLHTHVYHTMEIKADC